MRDPWEGGVILTNNTSLSGARATALRDPAFGGAGSGKVTISIIVTCTHS